MIVLVCSLFLSIAALADYNIEKSLNVMFSGTGKSTHHADAPDALVPSALFNVDGYLKIESDKAPGGGSHGVEFDIMAGNQMRIVQNTDVYIYNGFIYAKTQNDTNIRMGIITPTSTLLNVNTGTFLKNSGGVDGLWYMYANMPYASGAAYNPTFILVPRMPVDGGFTHGSFFGSASSQARPGWSNSNAGISFMTERSKGVRFGASYYPGSNNNIGGGKAIDGRGLAIGNVSANASLVDITTAGVNFLDEIGNVTVNASLTFEYGRFADYLPTSTFRRNDMTASMVGINLSYLGITVGGSAASWGKSFYFQDISQLGLTAPQLQTMQNGLDSAAYYYDYGVGYAIGSYNLGLTRFESSFMGSSMSNSSLTFAYDMPKSGNIKPSIFLDLVFYKFSPLAVSAYNNVDSTLVVVGFKSTIE